VKALNDYDLSDKDHLSSSLPMMNDPASHPDYSYSYIRVPPLEQAMAVAVAAAIAHRLSESLAPH
jgi:hypothetical protein